MGTRATSPPVIYVYYRIADNEPSYYTWSWDTTGGVLGVCIAYRNVDSIDIDNLNAQTGTGSDVVAPSISTNNDGDWIIAIGWADDDDISGTSNPSGMNERAILSISTGGNGASLLVSDEYRASAGSSGTRTWTLSSSEERSGIMLSITPATGSSDFQPQC
jgi:hypothetical protein